MEAERTFTRADIEGCNTRENTKIVIENVVYDVTGFLEEHPGGAERLLDNGGRDATRCFREVGHSDAALEWRRRFRVGVVAAADAWPEPEPPAPPEPGAPPSPAALLHAAGPPLALAALAWLLYWYLF